MGEKTRQLAIRPALGGILFAFFCAILLGHTASAQVDVDAVIPEGIIAVQGKASPNAQVKLYENGNTLPAASVIADSNGDFSQELPQMSTGVVNIGIQAIDTSGVKSVLIAKQVAIISQQTSTLTVVLPPTVTLSPESAPYGDGIMEFSGRTVPGATVKITIEPSTILSVAADSQGDYKIPLLVQSLASVGVYTYGIEVTAGSEVSDYTIIGTFVITPPIPPSIVEPETPLQRFVSRYIKPLSAPEITSPSEDEYTSSNPIVISGHATPGTEVTLYDEGAVIGIVLAGQDGNWQFYFSPHKEKHTIYAQSCQNGRCSENSRSVIIRRPDTGSLICKPTITLASYRLSATVDRVVELSGSLTEGIPGIVFISWGDGSEEKFSPPSNKDLKASHTYQKEGLYSGYIITSSSETCQTATYFTVEVRHPAQATLQFMVVAGIIIGALLAGWLLLRKLPYFRPSQK